MQDKIKCPNCGHKFDVEEALSGKLEAEFQAKYEKMSPNKRRNLICKKLN